jgi:riboflavin transporter FmnP
MFDSQLFFYWLRFFFFYHQQTTVTLQIHAMMIGPESHSVIGFALLFFVNALPLFHPIVKIPLLRSIKVGGSQRNT